MGELIKIVEICRIEPYMFLEEMNFQFALDDWE